MLLSEWNKAPQVLCLHKIVAVFVSLILSSRTAPFFLTPHVDSQRHDGARHHVAARRERGVSFHIGLHWRLEACKTLDRKGANFQHEGGVLAHIRRGPLG